MAERSRLDFYPSPALRKAIDRWRIEQVDGPSRPEAVRRIVERVLIEEGVLPPEAARALLVAARTASISDQPKASRKETPNAVKE